MTTKPTLERDFEAAIEAWLVVRAVGDYNYSPLLLASLDGC